MHLMQNAETIDRLVKQGGSLLKTFYSEYEKDPAGYEAEFLRGDLAGWRNTLHTLYHECAEEIVDRVLANTCLALPDFNFHRIAIRSRSRGHLGMAKRKFRIVKRENNIPVLGVCEYCDAEFAADPKTIGQPKDGHAHIQKQFIAHKCTLLDASQQSQNAMRVLNQSAPNRTEHVLYLGRRP